MKTQLAKQIKLLEANFSWIEDGMMLQTQKQRFYRLLNQGQVMDAYALIDEYKIKN